MRVPSVANVAANVSTGASKTERLCTNPSESLNSAIVKYPKFKELYIKVARRRVGEYPCDGSLRSARLADPRARRPSTNLLSLSCCRDRNPAARAVSSVATFRWTGSLVRWKPVLNGRVRGRVTLPNRTEPVLPVRTESVNRLSKRTLVGNCSVSRPCHCTREHRTGRKPNNSTPARAMRSRLPCWCPSSRDSWKTTCILGR